SSSFLLSLFFLFTAPSTPYIYTLSLHDALPILRHLPAGHIVLLSSLLSFFFSSLLSLRLSFLPGILRFPLPRLPGQRYRGYRSRSEEHTSELQSRFDLVCRLLLEKKKKKTWMPH